MPLSARLVVEGAFALEFASDGVDDLVLTPVQSWTPPKASLIAY